jgi:hypothetical protein
MGVFIAIPMKAGRAGVLYVFAFALLVAPVKLSLSLTMFFPVTVIT